MPISRNLEPGQYQLGDFVFGANTLFNVEQFDIGGWDVNVQDAQAQMADEIRFGSDSFKPNPIQITLNARRNRVLQNVASLVGDNRELNFENDRQIGDFTREWRADEVRKAWGALKPLYVCRPDGTTIMVYGRPGKIAVSKEDPYSLTRNVVAEFRRSDTLAYNEFEWFLQMRNLETYTVLRSSALKHGDAASWMRFLLVGPMTNPVINMGTRQIELQWELEPGEVVEISGYPWSRRCIRLNDGASLAARLNVYLDQLYFQVDTPYLVSWTAEGVNEQKEERDFASYSDTTEGLLPADWYPTVYTGGGTSNYRIASGKLAWHMVGNSTRVGASIFKLPTVSEYQTVGIQIASPGEVPLSGAEPSARIIGRSNVSGSEYLFWQIGRDTYYFGYNKDGTDYALSPLFRRVATENVFQRFLRNLYEGLFGNLDNRNWEADFGTGAGVLSSSIRINGVTAQSVVVDPADVGIGVTQNRNTGVGLKATNGLIDQNVPGSIRKFWMRDNSPEPQDVSGIYMFWQDAWQNI